MPPAKTPKRDDTRPRPPDQADLKARTAGGVAEAGPGGQPSAKARRRAGDPTPDRAVKARQARKEQDTIRLLDPLTTRLGTRIDTNALIFDSEWYRAQYPDVAASRIDPVRHYLNDGAREGRDPNPYFDTDWYVSNNPDVAAARQNPFLHYLLHGAQEGRLPAPPAG